MKKKDYIIPSINVIKVCGISILAESIEINSKDKAENEEVGW